MAIYTLFKNDTQIAISDVIEPALHLELNGAGNLEFTETASVQTLAVSSYKDDTYTVFEGDDCIFSGRPTELNRDYLNRQHVYVEGAYAYLNDTITGKSNLLVVDAVDVFNLILQYHNEKAPDNRKIQAGIVTVDKGVVRQYNYVSCYDAMKSLQDECGGYMYMTYTQDGTPVLNWLAELTTVSSQAIELGVNILDFTETYSPADIITALMPLGSVIEITTDASKVDDTHILDTDVEHLHLVGQNLTLTNRTVVSDSDVITNELVSTLGYNYKTETFNDAHTASELLEYANRYMSNIITDMIRYTADVVDIHYADGHGNVEKLQFATNCHAISSLYHIDTYLPISEMDLNLQSAVKEITIGSLERQSLSKTVVSNRTTSSASSSELQKEIDDVKSREPEGGGSGGSYTKYKLQNNGSWEEVYNELIRGYNLSTRSFRMNSKTIITWTGIHAHITLDDSVDYTGHEFEAIARIALKANGTNDMLIRNDCYQRIKVTLTKNADSYTVSKITVSEMCMYPQLNNTANMITFYDDNRIFLGTNIELDASKFTLQKELY